MTAISSTVQPTIESIIRKTIPGDGENPILDPNNPNLDIYYTGQNVSGSSLIDESPNGDNGTINGAVQSGDAMVFDGNDYITTPVANSSSQCSLSMELEFADASVRQFFCGDYLSSGSSVTPRITIGINSVAGKYSIAIGNGAAGTEVDTISHGFVSGVRKKVAITIDGTAIEIFEDGVSVGTATSSVALTATAAGGAWTLGRPGDFNGIYMTGEMRSIRRFSGLIFTQEQVNALAAEA